MPNNTTNKLKIIGEKKDIKKCLKFIKDENQAISFEKILPMPTVLHEVSSPVEIVSQEEYDKIDRNSKKGDIFSYYPITKEIQKGYIEKYGYDNWYDWAVKNWGTKWNAYDVSASKNGDICFYTAWSVAYPVFKELSKKFPKLTFELSYADEGGSWCGTAEFKNGRVADDQYSHEEDGFAAKYEKITGIDITENEENA